MSRDMHMSKEYKNGQNMGYKIMTQNKIHFWSKIEWSAIIHQIHFPATMICKQYFEWPVDKQSSLC